MLHFLNCVITNIAYIVCIASEEVIIGCPKNVSLSHMKILKSVLSCCTTSKYADFIWASDVQWRTTRDVRSKDFYSEEFMCQISTKCKHSKSNHF